MWRLRWRWCHTQEEKWIWWTHMIREKQPFHNVGVKVWEWRSPWIICNKHTYIYIYLILLYLLNYFSFLNTKLLHPFIFYKCIAKGWSIQKQILKYWLCIDEQGWNVFCKIKIERSQKLCLYLYKQREEIQYTVRTGNTTKLTGSSNI